MGEGRVRVVFEGVLGGEGRGGSGVKRDEMSK